MVTPVSMREVIAGKPLPTFGPGLGALAVSVALAVSLFGMPLRGSAQLLAGKALPRFVIGLTEASLILVPMAIIGAVALIAATWPFRRRTL